MKRRDGFATLTILWIVTCASIIAMATLMIGHTAVIAGTNRIELTRARWEALGCARKVQAQIDHLLRIGRYEDRLSTNWRNLPSAVRDSMPAGTPCVFTLEAAGEKLDVNATSPERMAVTFAAAGMIDNADLMAAALADWMDADDSARDGGLERAWYVERQRLPPSNAPIVAVEEIAHVRGFEAVDQWAALLSVAPGRVPLSQASTPVLMSLPGISREAAERIVTWRSGNPGPVDLAQISSMVSRDAATELLAHFTDALRLSTPDPDAWILTTRVQASRGTPTVTLIWRVERSGQRCVVSSTRSDL